MRAIPNHMEFRAKLSKLGLVAAEAAIKDYAHYVGLRWLKLAETHLREAKRALEGRSSRATYSRVYYAAYNASKAVRYIASGYVSLKADDHQKASELPGDFPNRTKWGPSITKLYEQRLRADYDNWGGKSSHFTMKRTLAVNVASDFLKSCRAYLKDRHGLNP